jgi:hypothetical protein
VSGSSQPRRPPRWWLGTLAWPLCGLSFLGVAATVWLDQLLRQAGRPELVSTGAGAVPLGGATLIAAVVGALVASRQPRHPVGWLLVTMGLSLSLSGVLSDYVWYGLVARPGTLPAAGYLAGLANGINIVYVSCAGFILLLTPTGTLPSRRWRWWARVAAAAAVVFVLGEVFSTKPLYPQYPEVGSPIGVQALAEPPLDLVVPLAGLIVLVALVAGAWSLVGRFRHARGIERAQLRWLAWGATLAATILALAVAELAWHGDTALWQAAIGACLISLLLATGAAVLRYRLYDIDRIISRTLAYALLSLLLGAGYVSVVIGLGRLLPPESSSLVVATATLAVAAAFHPLRRRVQAVVNRRFNRRRYDAARTVEHFAARLRDQVDLDALRGELLAVVDQTMQPTQASLWLRSQAISITTAGPSGDRSPTLE